MGENRSNIGQAMALEKKTLHGSVIAKMFVNEFDQALLLFLAEKDWVSNLIRSILTIGQF